VAVIRYFGGVKLGTGGLARAYGGTAKLALDAAVITPFVEMRQMQLVIDYARLDSFIRDLAKLNGQLLNKRFDERVNLSVSVPAHEVEVLKSRYPQT
jgi:putative IMPACT (imprinted ancient) family translation regulator